MAAEKLLSEAKCKAAKPAERIYYLNDGAGLRLRVRPDGGRTWLLRFFIGGKEGTHGIGPYPQVSLQIARAKAEHARQLVASGQNPSTANRVAKAAQITKNEATFGAVAANWLEHNRSGWSAHHLERNEGLLRRYLLPDLARLPIDSIEEHYLFSILKRVYDQGTKESARRSRAVAAQVFSHARATHCGTRNPARDMADNPYFKKPPVKHFVALNQGDVGKLLTALNRAGTDQILIPQTVCALKIALYTGLRDHSIRGARWKEIDLENALWSVPAERMKSKRVHTIPLPTQAVEALEALKPITFRNGGCFVFPGHGKSGHIAENTLRLALHRLGFEVTVHGMRSLITDVLNENKFNVDAIERQLDHQEQNQVRRAYLRSDFMTERIAMMQWFADWCDAQLTGKGKSNVLTLRRA